MEKTACLIVDVQQAATAPLPDGGEGVTKRLSRLIGWCRQQMVPHGLQFWRQKRRGRFLRLTRHPASEGELVLDRKLQHAPFWKQSWRIGADSRALPS